VSGLTHIDESGAARMVDVGGKDVTRRVARAQARITMSDAALKLVAEGSKKGDVLQVARIAGIQAAKRTSDLIPLCHPLAIDSVTVDLSLSDGGVDIEATVAISGRTGVEMEALTAASVAALTVYDMTKAVDKGMVIERILLVEKEGGRSGHYLRAGQ
jgi:cyclic pyranopterin monophosphate synthase